MKLAHKTTYTVDVMMASHCPHNSHKHLEELDCMNWVQPCHLGDNNMISDPLLAEHMEVDQELDNYTDLVGQHEEIYLAYLHMLLTCQGRWVVLAYEVGLWAPDHGILDIPHCLFVSCVCVVDVCQNLHLFFYQIWISLIEQPFSGGDQVGNHPQACTLQHT